MEIGNKMEFGIEIVHEGIFLFDGRSYLHINSMGPSEFHAPHLFI